MPKGQYDRKAAKARREAALKAGLIQPKKTEKKFTRTAAKIGPSSLAAYSNAPIVPLPSGPVSDLYNHLNVLTNTRCLLSAPNVDHNAAVLAAIDAELIASVGAARAWREANFPQDVKVSQKVDVAIPKIAAPAPAPAPVPVPAQQAAPAPAPLPFTPQAVQELQKSIS